MGDLQDEARRLLDGITPGPWEWKRLTWLRGAVQEGGRRTQILTLDDAATDPTSADAELIEEAPRLVEALLAALDDRDAALVAAEAEQRRLREAIAAIEAVHQPIPEDPSFCSACTTSWPCETFRLVKASLADALGSVSAVPTDDEPATLEPEHWCDCPADACRGIGPDPGGCGYCWAKDSDEPCPNSGLYNDERDDATTLQDLHELLGLTPDDLLAKGFRIVPAVPLSVEEASDEH